MVLSSLLPSLRKDRRREVSRAATGNAKELRIRPGGDKTGAPVLKNERMSSLFRAVAEATEEAILNSLFRATTVSSSKRTVKAIPLDKLLPLLRKK